MQRTFSDDLFSFEVDSTTMVTPTKTQAPRVHYAATPKPLRFVVDSVSSRLSPPPVAVVDPRDAQTRRWVQSHALVSFQQPPPSPAYSDTTRSVFESDSEDEDDDVEVLEQEDEEEVYHVYEQSIASSDDEDEDALEESLYMLSSRRPSLGGAATRYPRSSPLPLSRPSRKTTTPKRLPSGSGLRPLTPASAAPAILFQSPVLASAPTTTTHSSSSRTPSLIDTASLDESDWEDNDLPSLTRSITTSVSSASSSFFYEHFPAPPTSLPQPITMKKERARGEWMRDWILPSSNAQAIRC